MIGIIEIGSYIPEERLSILEVAEKVGADEEFIREKLGVGSLPRMNSDEDTSGLCIHAYENIQRKHTEHDDIECVIVCTQNPDGYGIPHTSSVIHNKLGLPDECACFDVSLGCSGYVYSLSIARSFMEMNGLKSGLLFTCDPYSKIINPEDKNTALLFGDAASVTLLGDVNQTWEINDFAFSTKGAGGDALHNHDKLLCMNGRAVFNFALTEVPRQVEKLVEKSGMDYSDIDYFVFHQGSKYMVEQLAKRMGLPEGKVPINLEHGNTVSSTIPIILEKLIPLNDAGTIVLSGFGVGLSWASCILTRM